MEEESKILKKSLSLIYDERMKEEEKVGNFVFVFFREKKWEAMNIEDQFPPRG